MKIAHITDLHLRHHLPGVSQVTTRLSRRMPDLFARAIAAIRAERPDLVVCTGDLLDYPTYALDDPEMRELGARDYELVAEMLDRLTCPYVVVHGNHDHPALVRETFTGRSVDDALVGGHRVIVFRDDEVDGHVPRRLLGERERFLAAISSDGPPQIHVQHFLVWPRRDEGYPHTYREAEHLRDIIVGSGRVRLVLSGHYHPGIEPFCERGTWFAAAPAFGEPPYRWRVYEIDGDRVVTHDRAIADDTPPRKVVFLDRDGTITVAPSYRTGPDALALIPGAAEAIARLRARGFAIVTVSSQSAVGLGYVTPGIVASVSDRLSLMLRETAEGAGIDGVYCTYDHPDAILPEYRRADSPERKPAPGLLLRAAREMRLDLARAYMVGDCRSDVEAGRGAGARTALVRTGHGMREEPLLAPGLADAVVADLSAAADWIMVDDARRG